MAQPIYLDYNATTPLDPAVVAAMRPYLETLFGNPSSGHAYGHAAKDAVDQAREQVADLLGCLPDEVIFTSGGSESDNQAIKGIAFAQRGRGNHIITSEIEHPAVLNTCRYLEARHGFRVTYLPVDADGRIDLAAVEAAITSQTILITIMHANNEVGTLEPIAAIGRLARQRDIAFHTDAAQSVGKVPVSVDDLGVDLLTLAGHKLYAPKGIGALYIRRGTVLDPLIHGAGHEGGRRAGTENVPYIVALGTACALAHEQLPPQRERWLALRQQLLEGLEARVGPVKVNGHAEQRLPNTLNICVPGVIGEEALARATGVAASTGSACHAGLTEPSPVLLAMGIEPALALGALRLSLGRWTTVEEIDVAVEQLSEAILTLRNGAQEPV
ncbi:MAG TPA: cysteine desulfurase family protein [Ktedonobacterales bacterium]|nr:cysteine desulfurase family protein [Ktedonobacterales bacterium]